MPIPPPPPGFKLDTPTSDPFGGRPVIRRAPEAPKPNLPTGYQYDPATGSARPVPGLPKEFTDPKSSGKEAPSGYRFTAGGNLEAIPGGPADKKQAGGDFKPTEFQSKSAGFLGRMMRANQAWAGIGDEDKGPRGPVRQWFHETAPNIENVLLNGDQRQLADQNVEDFIAASLRQESGAAISPAEFDRQYRIFFPMPGDSADVIKQKAAARAQAIEGFKVAAGPLAEGALANIQVVPKDDGNPNNAALMTGGDIGFATPGGPGNPLSPEQQAAYDAWNKANPNATADQLAAFGKSIGVTIGNADAIVQARDKGAGVAPGSTAIDRLTPKEQKEVDQRVKNTDATGAGVIGGVDTITMGTLDKLGSGLEAVSGALQGEGSVGDLFHRRMLVSNAFMDRTQDEHPVAYTAGQLAGGFVLPGFGARTIPQLAGLGAGYGGLYGLGSSDTLADVPQNTLAGAGAGLVGGAAGGATANMLGRLSANRATGAGRDVYDAAERLGMTDANGNVMMMPADVGGTFTRRMTGAAAQGPVSAIPIVRQAQRVTEAAQGARDRIAAGVGQAAEVEAAGQAATRGSDAFIRRTSQRGNDLYRRAEAAAGDARVPLPRAIASLDQHIAELQQVPGGSPGLEELQGLRQQLDGDFTVNGIRGMRTQLRDRFMQNGLRGSDLERRVNDVVSAASEDIADGLAQQGRGNAAGLYRLADRYWRARLDTIDNVLQPIIGKQGERSGEEVMASINRAAVGNNARLTGLLRALPAEDQSTVRATIIDNLGRSNAGQQDAAGQAFSLPQFLTHWNKLSPGAKRTLFHGETRTALDDLARVAEGTRQAQRFQNFSNTAGGVTGQLLIAGVPYGMGGLFGTATALASQYGAGRLLASPRFTRWLVGAARTRNPVQHIERLSSIGAREGAIAGEISGLRQALLSAVNDNPAAMQAAASGPDQRNDGNQ